ncbi:MAG: hypothetical protein JWP57_4479 [Spirosoma sp.]|nr:hypothetical protein [Spirosoma sp.]
MELAAKSQLTKYRELAKASLPVCTHRVSGRSSQVRARTERMVTVAAGRILAMRRM